MRKFFKDANHPMALVSETVPDPSILREAILADIRIARGPAG